MLIMRFLPSILVCSHPADGNHLPPPPKVYSTIPNKCFSSRSNYICKDLLQFLFTHVLNSSYIN